MSDPLDNALAAEIARRSALSAPGATISAPGADPLDAALAAETDRRAQNAPAAPVGSPAAPDLSGGSVRTFSVGSDGELIPKSGPVPGQTGVPTAFPGLPMGLGDPFVGGAQLVGHALKSLAPSASGAIDDAARSREAEYQSNYKPGSLDTGRMIGNALATAPISFAMPGAGAAGIGARMLSGAASGSVGSALQPTDAATDGDFWKQKAEQAGIGAVAGGVAPALIGGAARIIRPDTSPQVSLLMSKGVRPTPGQILGGTANRIEEALTSVPLAGDAIKNARYGAVQEFNRGAINDALAPIGQTLGKDTQLGRQAIDEAATKISDAYNAILPQLKPQADPMFLTNMSNLAQMSRSMPPDRATQFQGILKNTVFDRMSPGGGMTGEGFKEADSKLGQLVRSYRNAPDPDIRQLGDGLLQAQSELRGMVSRSNPDLAPALDANNKAYSSFLRVQTAAARQGAEEGVFTPAQLSSAVRELDPTLRHSGFARGNAVMQDLSDAGKSVLGSKVPDSGTPLRGATMALPALYGAFLADPALGIGATAGGAGVLGAYSPWGRSALAHALTSRPDIATPTAAGLRATAPGASAGAAALARALAGF